MTTIVHLNAYRSPRARIKIPAPHFPAPHFPTGVLLTLLGCAFMLYGAFIVWLASAL